MRNSKPSIVYNPRTTAPCCKHGRWIEHVSNGLRLAGFADELNRSIRHTGHYGDECGDSTFRGVVYRLPHGRFAYGYADLWNNDAAFLCFDNDADDESEAAGYADQMAERAAETERDHNDAYSLGAVVADRRRGIAYEWQRIRETCAELRAIARGEWTPKPGSHSNETPEAREMWLRNDWLRHAVDQLREDKEWIRHMVDEHSGTDAFDEGLASG